MFSYADKDGDGKISYQEFQVMINPPKPPTAEKPILRQPAVKRVTIQTAEPEILSVTNFICTENDPLINNDIGQQSFRNNENYQEPFNNNEQHLEQFMESWNMDNSNRYLQDY